MDIRELAVQRAQLASDMNDELRHAAHSIIMALEALRLEIRASTEWATPSTEPDNLITLRHEADTLGTNALVDTLAAEQMTLDDITIEPSNELAGAENMVRLGTSPHNASNAITDLNDRLAFLDRHLT